MKNYNKIIKILGTAGLILSMGSVMAQPKCSSLSQRDGACIGRSGNFSGPIGNGVQTATQADGSVVVTLPTVQGVKTNVLYACNGPNGICTGGAMLGTLPPDPESLRNSCQFIVVGTAGHVESGPGKTYGSNASFKLGGKSSPLESCSVTGTGAGDGPYVSNNSCAMWVPKTHPNLYLGNGNFVECTEVSGISTHNKCPVSNITGYIRVRPGTINPSATMYSSNYRMMTTCENKNVGPNISLNTYNIQDWEYCSHADCRPADYSTPTPESGGGG